MTANPQTARGAYAPVNGLSLYYEVHGQGQPLVLLHGGLGLIDMFGDLLHTLAERRQVIGVDMQAHGRTPDISRPLRCELLADDVAGLLDHLGIASADVMGYSFGGAVALRTAIQHPGRVRRLVVVSTPYSRDGWFPENRAAMDQMGASAASFLRNTPIYQSYARVAPDPGGFEGLLEKMGDLLRVEYDWSAEVAALRAPTLLVFGDADSVSPAYAARFFELLGGGTRDGSWDRSGMSPHRLAILPNETHYTCFASPALAQAVIPFLDAP